MKVCDLNKEVSLIPSVSMSLEESDQNTGVNLSDASFHADEISLARKTGLAGCAGSARISGIPIVTVSSTASDQVMGSVPKDGSGKNTSAVAENLVAGKTVPAGNLGLAGTAGRSDSDSSGSPGVLSLNTGSGSNSNSGNNSCSMNESGGLSGEAAVAPSQVESDGVSVSVSTDERVHVPAGGFDRMHGEYDEQGSNVEMGIATEVGVHATCVSVGFDGAMQAHAGNTNLGLDMGGLHGTLGDEAGVGMPNQTPKTEMVQVDNGILKATELVTNVDKENGETGWDMKKTRDTGKKDKKKAPPSSALPSRRSTRNVNRSASVGEGSDIEEPTGSLVGLGSNQKTATWVFEPIVMEKDSERVSGSRPIQRTTRSEMMLKPDLWSETDACMVNKEQSSIPGSNDLSESSSTSVNVMDKSMDKIGDSPPADGSA
ncbi:hypothetical protein L1987_19173 [Smallanthus sonchifolius]|uniref:Uncharacterized protein n=1 Tax=Smallanthus sonchifolius TaxID=185202 RepID=A0ACB9J1R5_9ASTR|nr:hypothetical protein L1987_19173 [Smallanthus sonchifolius]